MIDRSHSPFSSLQIPILLSVVLWHILDLELNISTNYKPNNFVAMYEERECN